MPKLFSDAVIAEVRKDYILGMKCSEIAKKFGIKRQSTVKKWARIGCWDIEKVRVEQEASRKATEILVDEKAKLCSQEIQAAEALYANAQFYLKPTKVKDDVTGEERIVPRVSPQQLGWLGGVLKTASELKRRGTGMEKGAEDNPEEIAVSLTGLAEMTKVLGALSHGENGNGNGSNGNGGGVTPIVIAERISGTPPSNGNGAS